MSKIMPPNMFMVTFFKVHVVLLMIPPPHDHVLVARSAPRISYFQKLETLKFKSILNLPQEFFLRQASTPDVL